MGKLKTLELTDAELGMIEYWIEKNEREGWYVGVQGHYHLRLQALKRKIQDAKKAFTG